MTYTHPEVASLLEILNAQSSPGFGAVGAVAARQMIDTMAHMFERPAPALPTTDTHFAGPAGPVPVRIYKPHATSAAAPVMIYFHGGGWVIGSLDGYNSVCATMAEGLGMTVVSVDYRLAPEHPFPAAPDDCVAAANWVAGNPEEVGHPVSGICLSGDSAGGNLATVVAQSCMGKLNILGQLLIYPATDFAAQTGSMVSFSSGFLLSKVDMDWFGDCYHGSRDISDPRLSPLQAQTLAGQPPALVMTCALDPLRDQGRAYAAKLIEHGVPTIFREWPGQIHGAVNLRGALPSAHALYLSTLADFKTLIPA